jgi:hypothetical protein
MSSDPLGVESILQHMADALPTHTKDDTNSDISSSYEAIALFTHACMTAVGFRLLGFGEDQKRGTLPLHYNEATQTNFDRRRRTSKAISPLVLTMELLLRIALIPLCTPAKFDAICHQS